MKNWSGNLTYRTPNIAEPETVEAVQEIVRDARSLRVLGTRHCFNGIADSRSLLLSTSRLNKIISLDSAGRKVVVQGGMRYGDLCRQLYAAGFGIHNLASLPHISIAGACATATHGSGVTNGNLATAVSAMEIVNGRGEVISLSREKDHTIFNGAVVNLGALGVVTSLTLDLVPSYEVAQYVYTNLPSEAMEDNFDEIVSAGYSVSLFTDWQTDRINQVWIKRVALEENTDPMEDFFGATPAITHLHPLGGLSAENCTEQLGMAGPYHERLPHFKLNFTPSGGEELQAEYFIERRYAVEAIRAVRNLRQEIIPLLMITEIRTIDRDDCWMSPCFHKPSVAIHFTLKQESARVSALLPKLEAALEPFAARPHWGKLFTMSPQKLQPLYPELSSFRKLMKVFDPEEKFVNDFVRKNLM